MRGRFGEIIDMLDMCAVCMKYDGGVPQLDCSFAKNIDIYSSVCVWGGSCDWVSGVSICIIKKWVEKMIQLVRGCDINIYLGICFMHWTDMNKRSVFMCSLLIVP